MPSIENSVGLYDVSNLEEPGSGLSAVYFHPPLGEAIVTDLLHTASGAVYSEMDPPIQSDHFRLPSAVMPILIDRAAHLLRLEGRVLSISQNETISVH